MNGDDLSGIESRVARAKERVTPELDARIVRSCELAAGIAGAVRELEASPEPRRPWRWAAGIAVGVLLLSTASLFLLGLELGWWGGRGERGLGPPPSVMLQPRDRRARPYDEVPDRTGSPDVLAPQSPPPNDRGTSPPVREQEPSAVTAAGDEEDVRDPEPAAGGASNRREATTGGLPQNVDAAELAREGATIVRLQEIGTSGTNVVARVTSVYAGNAALFGREIELRPGRSGNRRSFLSWDALADVTVRGGSRLSFIAVVEEVPSKRVPDVAPVLAVALGEGYAVTLVPDLLPRVLPSQVEEQVVAALRDDLVLALADRSTAVRASAITALRHFAGDGDPKAKILWNEPDVAAALVKAARDRNARVRWQAAALDPTQAGESGAAALRELLFDVVPLVRQPASKWLQERGERELVQPLLEIADAETEERWSRDLQPLPIVLRTEESLDRALELVRTHEQALVRAQYVEAIARALAGSDSHPLRHEASIQALFLAIGDHDPQVRAAAAWGLGFVPVRSAGPLLQELPAYEDARVQALAAGAQLAITADPHAVERLHFLVSGPDVRGAALSIEIAARALKNGAARAAPGDPVVELLFEGLRHPHAGVRARTLAFLAWRTRELTPPQRVRLRAAIDAVAQGETECMHVAASLARRVVAQIESSIELQLKELAKLDGLSDEDRDRILERLMRERLARQAGETAASSEPELPEELGSLQR
jgi:hypothetical protein